MINIKSNGMHSYLSSVPPVHTETSHFSTSLLALDAMLHSPISGTETAHKVRKQLAYVYSPQSRVKELDLDNYAAVSPYNVDIRFRRDSRGHMARKCNTIAVALFDAA